MTPVEVKRTLVKSTPEVWARVGDLASLAEQLGAFGDIRITRVQPESEVEWEGDAAAGRVRLEPSGWGTRVILSAHLRAAPAPTPSIPQDAASDTDATAGSPAGDAAPEAVHAVPDTQATGARWQIFGRWLRRRAAAREELGLDAPGAAFAAAFEPPPVPEPAPEPPRAPAHEAERAPVPEPPPALGPADALAVLEAALDRLGAAHHRPFSR